MTGAVCALASEARRDFEREGGREKARERARTFADKMKEGEPNAEEGSEEATTELAESARPRYATIAESAKVLSVSEASCEDWCGWFSQFVSRTAYV